MLNLTELCGFGVSGDSSHKYWRLYATGSTDGSLSYIGEIELRDSIGGSDLTTPGMTCAASYVNASYPAANGVDNNTATQTAMGYPTTGQWLSYTFADPVEIKEVAWYAPLASVHFSPPSFELQYSDNGTDWRVKKSWTYDWPTSGWHYFN